MRTPAIARVKLNGSVGLVAGFRPAVEYYMSSKTFVAIDVLTKSELIPSFVPSDDVELVISHPATFVTHLEALKQRVVVVSTTISDEHFEFVESYAFELDRNFREPENRTMFLLPGFDSRGNIVLDSRFSLFFIDRLEAVLSDEEPFVLGIIAFIQEILVRIRLSEIVIPHALCFKEQVFVITEFEAMRM